MRKLRICLLAPPYAGHLNPLLGLGRELLPLAEVTVLSTPGAMRSVEAAGLHGHAIIREHERLILEIASPGQSVKGNPFLLFRQLKANVSLQTEVLEEVAAALEELRPDLVIADFTLPVAGVAAERHGIPWWSHLPSPCVFEAPDGPPAYFGGLFPAEAPAEQALHFLLRKTTRLFKRLMFWIFRRTFRNVGLPSVYREDGSERAYSPERILVSAASEIEFPRTYPPHFRFIGPLLYTPPVEPAPPVFAEGRTHVLVTLGSHLGHRKDEIATAIRDLADRNPEWIFHFTDGDPQAGRHEGAGNFQRHPFISYDLHLPCYDLVIHHGGSGILHHCLKHGIPAVVMPMDFDQFDNAARLVWAGTAVRADSPEELASAFREVVENPAIREQCRRFAHILANYEPGARIRRMVGERFS
ncbi:glycosyltransferase [Luteolibacter sp. SL250]|uniref:nucleotide disphospho-sugar-binding domain-containing protein n=1 Tax=Luteolibacter sp. SL250 TaxID=2995170 RepID=UPI0022711751|nr:nucleotide disphospho-sugar-binding domain-containing protein [Luteolibacter sp. SL250]WAC19250.1 glycosyltransferase [Luteolibacter sp. SL250]